MNTVRIQSLPNDMRRVTIVSSGERDLSAVVSADDLQVLVDAATNDSARGVHGPDEPRASRK